MSQPHLDLSAQPGKQRWVVVALSVAGVIIVLAVLLFAAFSSHFSLIGPAPAPTPVKDWQTYNDPSGHFTMRMPADWQEFETGHGSSSSAGISFQMTTYSFASQDRIPNTPPPISFNVNITPIKTLQQRQFTCSPSPTNDLQPRQIGHIPAYFSPEEYAVYFNSQYAAFSLTYDYRGLPGIYNGWGRPPVTPVTAAQIQAYHTIIETILDSFTALPDAPLAC